MSKVSDYWKCSSNDLYEQYEMKCYDELLEYSKENRDKIFDLWNNGEPEDQIIVRKVTKYAKSILEYFYAAFSNQPELNVMFELGQLLGAVDSIDKMTNKCKNNILFRKNAKEYMELLLSMDILP